MLVTTLAEDGTNISDWLSGWGSVAAAIIALIAIAVSVWAAIKSARVSYQVSESGYQASENLLTDLAVLLAALRSVVTKGAVATQNPAPSSLDVELEAIRRFQTSTSGLALSLHAGRIGSAGAQDDVDSGRWRVLRMNFTGLTDIEVRSAADNRRAGRLALDIERTIGTLNQAAIEAMRQEIKNLPNVLSSLSESRQRDILLRAFDEVFREREFDSDRGIERLRYLKNSGVTDPDVDMFIASVAGDEPALRDAFKRGADPHLSLGDVLERYAGFDVDSR